MRLLLPALLVLGSVGCDALFDDEVDGLRHVSGSDMSGSDGRVTFDVEVAGEDSLLVTAQAESGSYVFVDELVDPSGSVVFSASEIWETPQYSVAMGAYPYPTSSVGWPISSGSLSKGTWQVTLGVTDPDYYFMQNTEATVDVLLKEDGSFSGGRLEVSLVYAGSTAQDDEIARAVTAALDVWRDIYASVGIELIVEEYEYGNGALAGPGLGTGSDFESISSSTPIRSVNVVIVPEMVDGDGIYGLSGGIPGPLVSTDRSAVLISSLTSSGADLVYDAEEERILGETMAHEVGHFLGLFHPVEMTWDTWDSLSDTAECSTQSGCESQLGSNLMYPYPVCTAQSCAPQNELTSQQGTVVNHYVAVE